MKNLHQQVRIANRQVVLEEVSALEAERPVRIE
jgi:hypothetical protein